MQFLRQIALLVFIITAMIIHLQAQIADTAVARKILQSKDTVVRQAERNPVFKETDSTKLKNPNARRPGKAAFRSAVLPGWGQLYNKKIWKVPIVYAGLGITGGLFLNNLKYYRRTRAGYKVAYNIQQNKDSTGYSSLDKEIQRVFFINSGLQAESLRSYRDQYRQDLDYSVVFFIIMWALNVVDATVDAHLSAFDISPNLSFKLSPGRSEMANTNGLSLVLKFK